MMKLSKNSGKIAFKNVDFGQKSRIDALNERILAIVNKIYSPN